MENNILLNPEYKILYSVGIGITFEFFISIVIFFILVFWLKGKQDTFTFFSNFGIYWKFYVFKIELLKKSDNLLIKFFFNKKYMIISLIIVITLYLLIIFGGLFMFHFWYAEFEINKGLLTNNCCI